MVRKAACRKLWGLPRHRRPWKRVIRAPVLTNTSTFKEIVFVEKPAGRFLSKTRVFVWANTTTFKEMFSGEFTNLSAGFLFCLLTCEATAPQGSAAYCQYRINTLPWSYYCGALPFLLRGGGRGGRKGRGDGGRGGAWGAARAGGAGMRGGRGGRGRGGPPPIKHVLGLKSAEGNKQDQAAQAAEIRVQGPKSNVVCVCVHSQMRES